MKYKFLYRIEGFNEKTQEWESANLGYSSCSGKYTQKIWAIRKAEDLKNHLSIYGKRVVNGISVNYDNHSKFRVLEQEINPKETVIFTI